jgi:hypothetical protein
MPTQTPTEPGIGKPEAIACRGNEFDGKLVTSGLDLYGTVATSTSDGRPDLGQPADVSDLACSAGGAPLVTIR